ncbi:response regulator [Candidatus Woesearchaeota archaeon]|nr:response regulator [Candidatus Woesearchaeota archaeon]
MVDENTKDISVLLVDDERSQRLMGKMTLEDLGYQVDEAKDTEEALTLLSAKSYDLIILDTEMPGRRGYELCWDIKSSEQYSGIAVIGTSASFLARDKWFEPEDKNLHPDEFLMKLDLSESYIMEHVIDKLLAKYQ